MLTRISFQDFYAAIGVCTPNNDIPSLLIAEYLRAAVVGMYKTSPIPTQRILGAIEPRLQPLGYTRSRAADEYFERAADDTSSPVAVLNALVEIGDFIKIRGGAHYPAEARFIQLDASLYLIACALPTVRLQERAKIESFVPALGRITSKRPQGIPEQSLVSWLGAPTLDLQQFASDRFKRKRPQYTSTANEWQIYDASRTIRNWVQAQGVVGVSSQTFLCRFRPEGVATFQRGIGELRLSRTGIVCQNFAELDFNEANRVASGMHLINGTFRGIPYRTEGEWMNITFSTYECPEILRFLKALCAGLLRYSDDRITFSILGNFKNIVSSFLRLYGIDVFPRSS